MTLWAWKWVKPHDFYKKRQYFRQILCKHCSQVNFKALKELERKGLRREDKRLQNFLSSLDSSTQHKRSNTVRSQIYFLTLKRHTFKVRQSDYNLFAIIWDISICRLCGRMQTFVDYNIWTAQIKKCHLRNIPSQKIRSTRVSL